MSSSDLNLDNSDHLNYLNRFDSQFHRPDFIKEPLYVITPIFNPQRYRTRWKHANNFIKHMVESNAILYVIEATYGNREKVFVEEVSPRHKIIHVQTSSELWIKENLINIAVQHLPSDWKYMAWIDADIHFTRHDWVGETIQQLQHYDVVQMFSIAMDLDAYHTPYGISYGFMHDYVNGVADKVQKNKLGAFYETKSTTQGGLKVQRWHPGYAWAIRRKAFSDLGGLIDHAILGSADNHMSRCLIGEAEKTISPLLQPEYGHLVRIWQDRAEQHIKRNVGYVQGTILHYFHGAKVNRKYLDRWKVLVNNEYTPSLDIKRDWNGVYVLTDRNIKLRDQIRAYFKQRDEDNIDMKGAPSFLD